MATVEQPTTVKGSPTLASYQVTGKHTSGAAARSMLLDGLSVDVAAVFSQR